MAELTLDAGAVSKTIELLSRRVDERFPGSGLSGIGRQLERIAGQARARAAAIARPIAGVRVTVALLILLIAAGLAGTVGSLRRPREPIEAFQFVQVLESGINDVVLVGAGIFFLLTLETRIKRRRQDFDDGVALAAVNEVEELTTGLSRKIWQKLMILYAMGPEETEGAEAARR